MTISLRSYLPKDYSQVIEILKEGGLYTETWDTEEQLKKRIGDKPDSIIVVCDDETVVGCVYLSDDILPFIFRLAVRKEYRGKGVGKSLIKEATKRLKEHGHKEIALFANESDRILKEWYKRQGFKDGGLWRCMWREV